MLCYTGLSQHTADAYRQGAPDAHGQPPEHGISDGGAPCRCCLKMIPKGAAMRILAHRPFQTLHPYAESGPIFVCADACIAYNSDKLPPVVVSPDYLLKGYSADERIVYGTGRITPRANIASYASKVLAREDVAFVDLRSARNNCWQVRITRASA